MPIFSSAEALRGILDLEDRVHRGDRDGELVEVGLAGRELLQLHARPHQILDPALAAIAAGELDDLEREAGDQRHADDPRRDEQVPLGQAERREDEDRHDHHDQQEARAAARVQAREALGVLGRQRQVRLEAGDRLVLGAVVLEHAAQVTHAREQPDVAEEDRGTQHALDEPEQERRAELVLEQAGEPDRDDEEQADREEERDHHRPDPHRAGDRLLVLLQLRVGGDVEGVEADLQRLDERDDTADHGPAEGPVALGPGDERERLDVDLLVGRADGDGPRGDAAHHHALEHRLPADRCITLRLQRGGLGRGGLGAHV